MLAVELPGCSCSNLKQSAGEYDFITNYVYSIRDLKFIYLTDFIRALYLNRRSTLFCHISSRSGFDVAQLFESLWNNLIAILIDWYLRLLA